MTAMDIDPDPPHGSTGFPPGTSAAAVEAAAVLGRSRVRGESSAGEFRHTKVPAIHPLSEITGHLGGGEMRAPAEVRTLRPGLEQTDVRFRGVGFNRASARHLLRRPTQTGPAVLRESGHPYVPHLSSGPTRVAGRDVPLDTDGEPRHLEAVPAGPAGSYDDMPEPVSPAD